MLFFFKTTLKTTKTTSKTPLQLSYWPLRPFKNQPVASQPKKGNLKLKAAEWCLIYRVSFIFSPIGSMYGILYLPTFTIKITQMQANIP